MVLANPTHTTHTQKIMCTTMLIYVPKAACKKLDADACAYTQQPLHAQKVATMLLLTFLAARKNLEARSWRLTLALALTLNSHCTLRQLSQCCSTYSLLLTRSWMQEVGC